MKTRLAYVYRKPIWATTLASALFGFGQPGYAQDPNCWLDIWESDNYQDSNTRIYGPVDLPNLRNVNGKDWGDQIDSLIVGPKTQVWAYEDENFSDTEITFSQNQRVPNTGELNFHDDIDSIKMRCVP